VIDFTASQPQPSAERAGPLRETILVDADQGGPVVRHDGHPCLDNRTPVTLVGEARGSTAQQAGHDAFLPRVGCTHTRKRDAPVSGAGYPAR
jgi:hypothetical protein